MPDLSIGHSKIMACDHISGCYFVVKHPDFEYLVRKYLPQVNVKAHATLLQHLCRTTLTQTFVNTNNIKGIHKIRYAFPLFDSVSVVGFVCHVGDRVVTGEVKEKERARTAYREAIAKGETAGLLEQLPDASDVFTTTVGNVPPGASVVVEITYLSELKHDAEVEGVRFTIPTKISPRYGSYPGELYNTNNALPESKGFEVVIDAAIEDGAFIREMRSPSHPIAVSMGITSMHPSAKPRMNRASATLSLGSAELDKDFVLQVVAKEIEQPKALVETHPTIPNQRALMATLIPRFALKQQRPEIVFICDRSGSMRGFKIGTLAAALKVFLKSLPLGVKYNICSFGTRHDFLWPKSKSYDQSSLDEGLRYVEHFDASYGGTAMFDPIKDTLERRHKDMNLEVFLVTDGEIWDQQTLFDYLNEEIKVKKQSTRVFTLGIGTGVSHALIEGVARAGNGFSQAVEENEKLDSKVVRMLKAGLSPHVTDYSLEVKYHEKAESNEDFEIVEKVAHTFQVRLKDGGEVKPSEPRSSVRKSTNPISLFDTSADPDATEENNSDTTGESRHAHLPRIIAPKLLQAPHQIPPLFPFSRTSVYLLMSPETAEKTPKSVILRGTAPEGPLELEMPVEDVGKGQLIHQLAARKAVQELEEGRGWLSEATADDQLLRDKYQGRYSDMVEREAVRLGVQFQVGGKWSSFIAVEKQDEKASGNGKEIEMKDNYEWVDVDFDKAIPTLSATYISTAPTPSGEAFEQKRMTRRRFHALALKVPDVLADEDPFDPNIHGAAAAYSSGGLPAAQPNPSPNPQPQSPDPISALVDLQTFEGFWKWSDALLAITGVNGKRVEAAGAAASKEVLATAVTIVYFEKRLAGSKDTWELVVAKARAWLAGELGGSDRAAAVISAVEGIV